MPYVQIRASWVTMARTVNDPGPGGVMKLGKALATGVAEERPQTHDEELQLADEIRDIEAPASESEEVPAAR
ncbi:hypothetical protein OIA45_11025 [Streptomyces chartreusis]|uniref:hypothetical protein n=1 Tax=Streptomyces chartreusis TaxID=1969 RepID=UPI003864876F|nr:hypothetical protein OIA45_11025 [Streptomyces chartreusis]